MVKELDLKAVSVRQPWASLLLSGVKRFEARSWYPSSVGWLLLHASSNYGLGKAEMEEDPLYGKAIQKAGLSMDRTSWPRSAIIGAIEVVAVHFETPKKYTAMDVALCGEDPDSLWEIGDRIAFPVPIPCKGKLNFFSVDPSVAREVAKHIEVDDDD